MDEMNSEQKSPLTLRWLVSPPKEGAAYVELFLRGS
jgi:hypothetical protein